MITEEDETNPLLGITVTPSSPSISPKNSLKQLKKKKKKKKNSLSPKYQSNHFEQSQYSYLNSSNWDEYSNDNGQYLAGALRNQKKVGINKENVENMNDKLMKEIANYRRWRCACCSCGVITVIMGIVFIFFVIYTCIFRTPYAYVSQAQLTHRPRLEEEQWLGMIITAHVFNPTLAPLMLEDVFLSVEYQEPNQNGEVSKTKVNFGDVGNFTQDIAPWTTTTIEFKVRAPVSGYEAIKIYSLSTQSQVSCLVKGKFTLKLGQIYISQKVYNYHLYKAKGFPFLLSHRVPFKSYLPST